MPLATAFFGTTETLAPVPLRATAWFAFVIRPVKPATAGRTPLFVDRCGDIRIDLLQQLV